MLDVTSVSNVGGEISFTIRPQRVTVPMPCETNCRAPVVGQMAETIPSPEKEHCVKKVEQVFLYVVTSCL